MRRTTATFALVLAGMLGLTSCASDPTDPPAADESGTTAESEDTADAADAAADDSADDADSADEDAPDAATETTIPAGAYAASADFPFPIPEGWEEIYPFTEEKIGKSAAMTAAYAHPGDAESAAATYEELLSSAGFVAYENPVGALTNAASLMVEGVVNGVAYKGPLDFDTDSEGTNRVAINLTEED